MDKQTDKEIQRADRRQMTTKVEFFVFGDIEEARSVNVSETGIQFMTDEPIKVRLRLQIDGEVKEFVARMVWAKKSADDHSMNYGLEFIPDTDECVF